MSASDPLVQFIRDRLDEDEDYARQAFGAHNDAEPTWTEVRPGAILLDAAEREDELIPGDSGISRHIVRHDPARVLRGVEAKRRILDRCEREADDQVTSGAAVADWTLAWLASEWSDHEDYRQEWANDLGDMLDAAGHVTEPPVTDQ